MTMLREESERLLKQPTIVLVKEEDKSFITECMNKGIAMLIIPTGSTKEQINKLMDGYKNVRFMSIEVNEVCQRLID